MHAPGPGVVQTPRALDAPSPPVTDRSRALPVRLHRPARVVPGSRVVVEHDADAGLAPLPTGHAGWNRHLEPVDRSVAGDRSASPTLQDA